MSTNIDGKVAVLTGGSAGLGEDAVGYLAARGAAVVLGARRRTGSTLLLKKSVRQAAVLMP